MQPTPRDDVNYVVRGGGDRAGAALSMWWLSDLTIFLRSPSLQVLGRARAQRQCLGKDGHPSRHPLRRAAVADGILFGSRSQRFRYR